MTDAYDKINHWYGWNGGECPVHPETEVFWVSSNGRGGNSFAQDCRWTHDSDPADIIAFRITKLYVEPRKAREWWVNVKNSGSIVMSSAGDDWLGEVICVREVLPEDGQ